MSIRYRPMEPKDIRICAGIIARHPVYAPRYGEAIAHLGAAWQKLLGTDSFISTVFEEVQDAKSTVLGAGIAVFVTDDFVHELKTSPHFWIGPELVDRIIRGKSAILSDKELREANSSGGLNVATWQCGVSPEDVARGDVGNTIMAAFVKLISGFRIKEFGLSPPPLRKHVPHVRRRTRADTEPGRLHSADASIPINETKLRN